MFFTFVSDPPRQFPPMRVRVLELPLCASRGGEGGEAEGGGVWHAYEAVPYGEMWADDVLWMPQLLQHTGPCPRTPPTQSTKSQRSLNQECLFLSVMSGRSNLAIRPGLTQAELVAGEHYFEGHFVFEGGPGAGCLLPPCTGCDSWN
eukprot:190050-Rhodomonas_salina.4